MDPGAVQDICRGSVVEIRIHVSGGILPIGGVIVKFESNFLYIISHKHHIEQRISNSDLVLGFIDGTEVVIANDKITTLDDNFLGIACVLDDGIDTSHIKAVNFDEQKLRHGASVWTYSFHMYILPADLTDGFVSRTEDMFFYHTCRGGIRLLTKHGAPVFNKHGQLVGLCHDEHCSVLVASTVSSIAQSLCRGHGTDNMGINEILQHIYDSTMAQNGKAREQNKSLVGGQPFSQGDDQ
ncbi:hypothetical protein ACP70R_030834 [Stipagrostis hirtigluma subsp. patula]